MLKCAIVTIGDEILIGQIVDTNSAWIGQELNKIGIKVDRILSISDEEKDIYESLDNTLKCYDIVLVTGGLGPTKDDITKTTLCKLFDSEMVEDKQSLQIIESILGRYGVAMNPLNVAQALVPKACRVIHNYNGTAPAMMFERDNHILISMPGVPFEMKELCANQIFPMLQSRFGTKNNVHKSINTFGIAESILAERIAEWEDGLPKYMHLAYLPNPNRVKLRISIYDADCKEDALLEIDSKFEELKDMIPHNFMGDESDEVEVVLLNRLRALGKTVSVAESCTGGTIASKIVRLDGASSVLVGGVVAYSNSVKINVLGVENHVIDEKGAVSCEVVEQMARGVRRLTGSDYAIATSGVAGPTGGTEEKPVGTVWIGVDTPCGTFSKKFTFTKLREPNIERSASQAIYMLINRLIEEQI